MIARLAGLTLAVLLLLVGGLWTLQGLGYVSGGSMDGNRTWATVGPIVAGIGVALGIVVVQRGRGR